MKHVAASDFTLFSYEDYLREYYVELSEENQFLLQQMHGFYSYYQDKIGGSPTILEVGGGPTVYQLISASKVSNHIDFCDFLEQNRNEISRWKNSDANSFDWSKYIKYVQQLENSSHEAVGPRLKRAIRNIGYVDLKQKVFSGTRETYDIVSSHFCAESITADRNQFECALDAILTKLKRKGHLVMSFLKNARQYHVGNELFDAYPVNERYLKLAMNKRDVRILTLETFEVGNTQGYEGLIFLVGQR